MRLALLLLCVATPALAHDPASPNGQWFARQHNVLMQSCCGAGDAYLLDDNQWRIKGTDYEVQIDGRWYGIGRTQMLRSSLEDPNPTGKAVVWYSFDSTMPGSTHIWCFTPGTES